MKAFLLAFVTASLIPVAVHASCRIHNDTGWDFKVDAEGRYWCLECNPMPGYSFYDRLGQGAVSRALVELLS